MKLIASITFALVTARSRVADSDLKLDAYGEIHREKIHLEELLQSWNRTMGTAPPRGWYRMRMEAVAGVDPNEIIKKSGLEGKTATSFAWELNEAHYCRHRETETCCNREDQNCFTDAGCFCDEACFTTYGDCCQDHFVTCYDNLGLCLQDADEPEAKSAATNKYKQVNVDAKRESQKKMMNDAVAGVTSSTPMFVEPDSCCGNHKFNSDIDCCQEDVSFKFIKRGTPAMPESFGKCPPAESNEGEDSDSVDTRLQSPEPADAAASGFDFTSF